MRTRFILRCTRVGAILLAVALPLTIVAGAALADNDGPRSQQTVQADEIGVRIAKYIAGAGTMGLSVLAAGYAVGRVGAAAMGAASEKPEVLNRAVVLVALGEGLAILGMVVAIMIIVLG